ncbi:Alpha/Beta hydrolase protein [Truncatella angustata]|uniref:feruloyl esterase n=1 Tax=Truncatella angustata TaxID=152316 RepID=A0A9P8RJG5_9PEZI|nr:Alpha/Beta hydrolase protein [Truncatella angustata]KAH6645226.1 Alpha/Beta hydrolase protein [Truncatella angustata]
MASQNASSPGCAKADEAFTSGVSTRDVSGRSYLLSIPTTYSSQTSSPLILSFHGGGQSAETQLECDQFANPKVNDRYIVVYPEAVGSQWQVSPDSDSDDVDYISNILEDVESFFCIDLSRIYATGMSQGGGMVGFLACNQTLSTRIAAFAPVSGAFYVKGANKCDPASVAIPCSPERADVPILEFHGGGDQVIPYYGDDSKRHACLPAIPHWVETWAEQNNLGSSNISTSITTSATLYQFGSGSKLGLVSHVYDGSSTGHVWPTTKSFATDIGGSSTASFNATPMILDFFSKYNLYSFNSTEVIPTSTSGNGTGGSNDNGTSGSSSSFATCRHGATLWWLLGFYIAQKLF